MHVTFIAKSTTSKPAKMYDDFSHEYTKRPVRNMGEHAQSTLQVHYESGLQSR